MEIRTKGGGENVYPDRYSRRGKKWPQDKKSLQELGDRDTGVVRQIAVPAEIAAETAKYSLKAYENGNPTNRVSALLFTPKPVGMNALPMIVYIPGNGELGDIALQFRLSNAEFRSRPSCGA